ncbi:unnamed protein product [Clavelina lepadiformis]|uniref:Uncharacterized protein n=1 Tax=Clavelina lepadiformis TaxID=159417 RepID=A0ABP0FQ22_CLALP
MFIFTMASIYFAIPPPKYEPNEDFLSFFNRFDAFCTMIEANPALRKHLLINSLDEDLSWDVRGRDLSLFDLEYDELVKRGTEARPPICSTESNKCRVLKGTRFDADRAISSLAFAVRKRICAVETPASEEQAAESAPAEEATETPASEEQAVASTPAEQPAETPAPEEQAAESAPAEQAAETPAPEEQAAESAPAEEAAETPAPEEQAAESAPAEQAAETPAPEEQAAESAPAEQAAETPAPEEQAAESAPAEQAAETPAPEEQAVESAPASKQRIWDVSLFRYNHEVSQSSDFCAVESSATPGDGCSPSWTVGLGCVVLINNGAPND